MLTSEKNNEQVVWDMKQTIFDDPMRRFTYAFSIVDAEFRVWYTDRTGMVVSECVDFMEVRDVC